MMNCSYESRENVMHRGCPLNDLIQTVPAFESISELYFRCKICDDAKIHTGVESYLEHLKLSHSNFCVPSTLQGTSEAKQKDSSSKEDSSPVVKKARIEDDEDIHDDLPHRKDNTSSQQSLHTNNGQNYQHTIEPANMTTVKSMHEFRSKPNILNTMQSEIVVTDSACCSQEGFVKDHKSQALRIPTSRTGQKIHGKPLLGHSQSLNHNQVMHTFQIPKEKRNHIVSEEANMIYHVITEKPDGQIQESHVVDAIFPEHIGEQSGVTCQQVPAGAVVPNFSGQQSKIIISGTGHSVSRIQPMQLSINRGDKGNAVVMSNLAELQPVPLDTAQSVEIITSLANKLHQSQPANTAVQSLTNICQQQKVLHETASVNQQLNLQPQFQHQGVPSQQQQVAEDIDNIEELGSSGINISIEEKMPATIITDDNAKRVWQFQAQIDEIPVRGRPPNWVKQVECIATKYELPFSLSTVSSPGVLHRGPLHHKDRVQETLLKCVHTTPGQCQYLVLGQHYHCRACRAIVREEDLILHRYSHSSVRLIMDVNLQKVILQGRFCEDVSCGKGNEGSSGSVRTSVIHMHCNLCQDILETGYKFHEHLKRQHSNIWLQCQVYDEGDTDSEQCLLCRGYFGSVDYLNKHMTDRHFAKYKVQEMQTSAIICCREQFAQIEPYRIHVAVHHKTLDPALFKPHCLPVRCLECGEDLVGKQTMYKHHWLAHKQNSDKKACTLCNFTYSSWTEIQEHMRVRHHVLQIMCTDCAKSFQDKHAFKKHFLYC